MERAYSSFPLDRFHPWGRAPQADPASRHQRSSYLEIKHV